MRMGSRSCLEYGHSYRYLHRLHVPGHGRCEAGHYDIDLVYWNEIGELVESRLDWGDVWDDIHLEGGYAVSIWRLWGVPLRSRFRMICDIAIQSDDCIRERYMNATTIN